MWVALSLGSSCAPPWLTCRHPWSWAMAVECTNLSVLNVSPYSHTERAPTSTEMDPSAAPHTAAGRAANIAAYPAAVAGAFFAQDAGAGRARWVRLQGPLVGCAGCAAGATWGLPADKATVSAAPTTAATTLSIRALPSLRRRPLPVRRARRRALSSPALICCCAPSEHGDARCWAATRAVRPASRPPVSPKVHDLALSAVRRGAPAAGAADCTSNMAAATRACAWFCQSLCEQVTTNSSVRWCPVRAAGSAGGGPAGRAKGTTARRPTRALTADTRAVATRRPVPATAVAPARQPPEPEHKRSKNAPHVRREAGRGASGGNVGFDYRFEAVSR